MFNHDTGSKEKKERADIYKDKSKDNEKVKLNNLLNTVKQRYYNDIYNSTKKRDHFFEFDLRKFLQKSGHTFVLVIADTVNINVKRLNRPHIIVKELLKKDYQVIYAYRRTIE